MAHQPAIDGHAPNSANTEGSQHHITSIGVYLAVFVALMVLLVATSVAARINLDERVFQGCNLVVAMTIGVVKAVLVVLVFMHVLHSSKLLWVFAGASFVWLSLLFVFPFADYLTRGPILSLEPTPVNAMSATPPSITEQPTPFEHTNSDADIRVVKPGA